MQATRTALARIVKETQKPADGKKLKPSAGAKKPMGSD
jgi:hypothetical protein